MHRKVIAQRINSAGTFGNDISPLPRYMTMVFPRNFFALCALLLIIAGIHAKVQKDSAELTDDEVHLLNTFIAQQDGEIVETALEKNKLVWIFFAIFYVH